MNQKYEGGGFKFCPHASPSDGYLDVIVVDGLSKPKVLCCLPTAFFGKHTLFRGVHIFRCKKIDIHSDLALPVHKDGESAGILKDFSVWTDGFRNRYACGTYDSMCKVDFLVNLSGTADLISSQLWSIP